MNIVFKLTLFTVLTFGLNCYSSLSSTIIKSFNPDQKKLLQSGEVIQYKNKIKGSSWEELTFYQYLPLNYYKAAAVFSDIEKHKEFVPNMLKSKIVKKIRDNFFHVSFEVRTPWPLPNAKYTVTNEIIKEKDSIIVKWKQLNSNTMDDNVGFIKFKKISESKTFVTYQNLIVPSNILAGLFKSKAERDMFLSYKIMMKHIGEVINGKKPGFKNNLKLFNMIK